jgi:hypothetical protein
MVISNLSTLLLIFFKALAQYLFFFTKELILWGVIEVRAVSLPEKNADRKNKSIKVNISIGDILLVN